MWESLKNLVVKLLPMPVIPQKRYILILVAIGYMVLKPFVQQTPTPTDDKILEKAHEIALQLLADNDGREDYQPDQHYGEQV